MSDLKQIIRELNRRREKSSLISTLFVVKMLEGFVQELQEEAEDAAHSSPLRPVTAEVLRRVIGDEIVNE